jgi:hypothetical protein
VTDETKEVGEILNKIAYQVVDVQKVDHPGHFYHQEWCIKDDYQTIWIKQWDNGFTCDIDTMARVMRGMELLETLAERFPWVAKILAEPMK